MEMIDKCRSRGVPKVPQQRMSDPTEVAKVCVGPLSSILPSTIRKQLMSSWLIFIFLTVIYELAFAITSHFPYSNFMDNN